MPLDERQLWEASRAAFEESEAMARAEYEKAQAECDFYRNSYLHVHDICKKAAANEAKAYEWYDGEDEVDEYIDGSFYEVESPKLISQGRTRYDHSIEQHDTSIGLFEMPFRLGGFIIWLVFQAPGIAICWQQYYFPQRGQVLASGRRRGNKGVQFIYSVGFWLVIALLIAIV